MVNTIIHIAVYRISYIYNMNIYRSDLFLAVTSHIGTRYYCMEHGGEYIIYIRTTDRERIAQYD